MSNSELQILVLLVVLLAIGIPLFISFKVLQDAKRLGFKRPELWGIATFMLFMPVLPLYLLKRYLHLNKKISETTKRLVFGIPVSIFIVLIIGVKLVPEVKNQIGRYTHVSYQNEKNLTLLEKKLEKASAWGTESQEILGQKQLGVLKEMTDEHIAIVSSIQIDESNKYLRERYLNSAFSIISRCSSKTEVTFCDDKKKMNSFISHAQKIVAGDKNKLQNLNSFLDNLCQQKPCSAQTEASGGYCCDQTSK